MEEPSQKSQVVVSGLLRYLKETGQTELLGGVTERLSSVADKGRKAKQIVVTSTIPISPSQNKTLRELVKKALGVDIPLINRIDKSLLGGLTIKVGDWYVDSSLQGELLDLSELLRS